jgi:hypothetical protein
VRRLARAVTFVGLFLLWARPARAEEGAPPTPTGAAAEPQPPQIIVLPPEMPTAPPPPVAAPLPVVFEPPPVLRTLRVEAAATLDRIYDIPIRGGEGTIGLGFELNAPLSIDVHLTVFYGAQETGLAAIHVRVGTDIMGRIGRFRIGGGVTSGVLSLAQATGSTNDDYTTFGLLAVTSLDVVQWGLRKESAFFVEAKLEADVVLGADAAPMMWGPTFGAGLRY